MPDQCPDCGALLDGGASCKAIFDAMLVLEFTDPGYGAVHMLTVACYMIQHRQYSDEGLVWMEKQLRAYLEEGVSTEAIRRKAAGETGQDRRSWKVTRPPGAPPLLKINWSMTIADAMPSPEDAPPAEVYRERVTEWARVTLREMQPWRERIRKT
ncbi:MAG: hypothetical protein GX491_21920 [Chloroflexi bacterium]|nr:hypothetical protein [Chloroflexota bacterium]